jgi:hypothetical protein
LTNNSKELVTTSDIKLTNLHIPNAKFARSTPVQYNFVLTPCSGALLKKPVLSQPVKEFPALYGIGGFIIVFTKARHLSLF